MERRSADRDSSHMVKIEVSEKIMERVNKSLPGAPFTIMD